MPTNDHTVPQKYLRRFAELRSGKGYYTTVAAPVDNLTKGFTPSLNKIGAVKGFYWATNPDGTDHHEMESLLQRIEDAALPAFLRHRRHNISDAAVGRRRPPGALQGPVAGAHRVGSARLLGLV